MKKCPYCAEEIQDEAIVCKHCGNSLKEVGPEKVIIELHPVMFLAHPIVFIIFLTLVPLYGIGLLIFLIWYLICKSQNLTITNKRTILKKGLLSKYTSEVLHSHVLNVQIFQGTIQRITGVGTIGVSSAAQSNVEIKISDIKEPYKIKEIIDKNR